MGYAEMLADSSSTVPPHDVASLAQQILGAGQRLNRMSENALLYIQLELLRHGRGNMAAQGVRTPTRLSDVVSVEARAKASAYGRDADLVLELKEASTSVNRAYVEKIVDELVDNAFKFSPPRTQVRVSVATEGASAILRVSDAGPGMSEEQIAGIGGFVQFERSVREQQGLGLGLSIAKGVANLWGGTMSVDSTLGAGTTVTVSLPAPSVAASMSRRPPGPGIP
jgi:signal transduction histidine kinase